MEDFTVTQQDLENYLQDKINSLKEELLATEKALLIFKHAQLEIALDKFKASQKQEAIEVPQSVTLNADELMKNVVLIEQPLIPSIEEIRQEEKEEEEELSKIKAPAKSLDELKERIEANKIKHQEEINLGNQKPISKQQVEELVKCASGEDFTQKQLSPTSIHILTYQIKPLMTVDEFLADARTIRFRLNYSAEKVSRKFDISKSSLYFIENGTSKGTKIVVKSISALYGITLTDLDEKYGIKENGRYQEEHKLAYVKKDKTLAIDNNGKQVKRIYKKRQSQTKSAPEDA